MPSRFVVPQLPVQAQFYNDHKINLYQNWTDDASLPMWNLENLRQNTTPKI